MPNLTVLNQCELKSMLLTYIAREGKRKKLHATDVFVISFHEVNLVDNEQHVTGCR